MKPFLAFLAGSSLYIEGTSPNLVASPQTNSVKKLSKKAGDHQDSSNPEENRKTS
jgi:hypothetical protein